MAWLDYYGRSWGVVLFIWVFTSSHFVADLPAGLEDVEVILQAVCIVDDVGSVVFDVVQVFHIYLVSAAEEHPFSPSLFCLLAVLLAFFSLFCAILYFVSLTDPNAWHFL